MKIALINGSPKVKESASEAILNIVKDYLPNECIEEYVFNKPSIANNVIEEILNSEAIVLAFPLYIDSIPAHLLRCMMQIEEYISSNQTVVNQKVYVIVNNGFFDGKQNTPAIESVKIWCEKCKFSFAQGIGIGGGGMIRAIQSIPNEHGPKKNIGIALKAMGENISAKRTAYINTLEPNYPKFLYKMQAEHGWRLLIKKNGLRTKELNRKW